MAAQHQQDEVGCLWAKAIPRQGRTHIVVSGFLLCVVLLWNPRLLAEKSGQAGWMTSRTKSSQTAKPTGMQRPFCSRSQLQHGRWIQSNMTTRGTPIYNLPSQMCKNRRFKRTDSYEWEPNDESCWFEPWNATKFCSVMKGSSILFLGDSLTYEQFFSLVNMLGGKTESVAKMQMKSMNQHKTIIHSVCDHNETFILYRRDDHLQQLPACLEETFPDVLILNRGAHYVEDHRYMTEFNATIFQVKGWQQQCQDYGIKCHFFYRTSVPGHPDCQNFTAPVNNLTAMEELVASGMTQKGYHWSAFQHQNQLILNRLALEAQEHQLDYQVIDAYHTNILRPDQHLKPPGDCLHSCLPGKVDVQNRFFLHFLVQSRTLQDIQTLEQFMYPWNRSSNVDERGILLS